MMKANREITVKMASKEGWCVRVNEQGVFQYRKDAKHSKKLFNFTKQISVQIIKTELLNGEYKFIVKLTEDTVSIDLLIQNKECLEEMFVLLGKNSVIKGLNDITTDFNKIGQGSFATVFQATTHYETTFALKSFEKKHINDNEKTRKAFRNELLLMKSLNNPHIISYDYLYETEKTFYLKMEYFPKCLREKVAGKVLIKQQKEMIKQLLSALLQMKNKGIIHRDLKPDNIMVRTNAKGEDECVIIDFGLATFTDSLPYLFTRCGTPGFLSPEIANLADKNQRQHCPSDMFSLGCIFYKILTGHYLFPGKTAKQVLLKNRKCNYSLGYLDDLTAKQKDLLLRMIEVNPQTRITPEQALKHPYFEEEIDDADQIPEEGHSVLSNIRKISNFSQVKNMDTIRSSVLLQSTNFLRFSEKYDQKNSIRDSCLTFQIGCGSTESCEEPRTSRSPLGRSTRTPSKFRPAQF